MACVLWRSRSRWRSAAATTAISGRTINDGGIVIDLARLNRIDILDAAGGRIRLGPGARWGYVAQALVPLGLAMSLGDCGDVGVG